MKRLFSGILILVFMLSGICIPYVSASEDDKNVEDKALLLTRLGVLDSEWLEGEEQNIARGQFCKAAIRMLGYPDEVLSSTDIQMFFDVPVEHYAAGAINLANSKGIMTGVGDRMFEPEESVTYEQALKIMVSVLGWTRTANSNDIMSWCVSKAGELGITKGIMQSLSAALTKDAMITLLYNCLECDALVVESMDVNGSNVEFSNLLYASFNAVKAKGTVTANAMSGLKGEGTHQYDEIEISGERYFSGDIDAGQYLGYNVTFYYIEPKTGEIPQLLLITNQNTKVTEIKARDLEKFSNGQYTYTKENGTTGKLNISQSTDIIYNGKSPVNVNEDMYMPKTGRIRVISRGSASSADVVFIEEYYNIFVCSINQQEKTLYDKYDSSKRLELKSGIEGEDYDVVYDNGEKADFSSIKKDTLVSIMKSDDEKYVKIIINSNKQTGKLSAVNKDTVVMDGTKYYLSKLYDTALQPKLSSGETGTLYLDIDGEAAVFISESAGAYQYGFLMNAWIESGGDKVGIKLLASNGEVQTYDVKIPVSIDSLKVKTDMEILNKLSSNGNVERQVIRYVVNDNNEINKIDLPYKDSPQPNEKENSLHLEYDSGTAGYEYKSYAGSFSGKAIIDDSTIIFSVPEEKMSDDMYTVESKSYFVNDVAYRLKSYMIDPDGVVADVVVVIKSDDTAISDTTTLGLVNSIYTGLSADEIECSIISVYNDGVLKELPIVNEELLTNADIESGDVIRFALSSKGEINILEKTYDYSEDVMINSESHNNRLYNAKFKLIKGGLYNKSGKVIVVGPLDKMGSGTRDDYTKYTLVTMSNIYVYDSSARKGYNAYIGSENDLVDYLHAGGDYSKLFIRSEYAQPKDIIIYK